MRLIDQHDAFLLAVKRLGKPAIIVMFPDSDWYKLEFEQFWKELHLAAPWLEGLEDTAQALTDGHALLVFDTEEERDLIFSQTKGDDPNDVNSYDGVVHVYMLTVNVKGKPQNENT